MTTVIAITGGIGSGKSTFSKEVIKRGYKLLDSDKEVAYMYDKPKKAFINHLRKIGLEKAIQKNKIDKSIIANEIFSNSKIKHKLEEYIFKLIRLKRDKFIKSEKKKKTKIVFLDIPLLFENNLHKNFDIVISIISVRKLRYLRLKKNKGMKKEMFEKILKNQTTDIERKKKSDIVIFNNESLRKFLEKTSVFFKTMNL